MFISTCEVSNRDLASCIYSVVRNTTIRCDFSKFLMKVSAHASNKYKFILKNKIYKTLNYYVIAFFFHKFKHLMYVYVQNNKK